MNIKDTRFFGDQIKAILVRFPNVDIEELVAYINNNDIAGIVFSQDLCDQNLYDLSFMTQIRDKEKIVGIAVHCECENINFLYEFPNLIELSYGVPIGKKVVLDLNAFPRLKVLGASGDLLVEGLENVSLESLGLSEMKHFPLNRLKNGLKKLYLRKVKVDFQDLSHIQTLREIEFVQLRNLNFLGLDTKNVEVMKIAYCPQLRDYSFLSECSKLEILEMERCKNLEIKHFEKLLNLKRLILSACKEIPTISFINSLSNLEMFTFPDTEVLDGDLRPCLRLEYAWTTGKKHYNLKIKQLPGHGSL